MANGEVISLQTDRQLRAALAEYSKVDAKPEFVEGVDAFARAHGIVRPGEDGLISTLVRLGLAPGLVRVQINFIGTSLRDIVVTPDVPPTFATVHGFGNKYPADSISELPLEFKAPLSEAEGQALAQDIEAIICHG